MGGGRRIRNDEGKGKEDGYVVSMLQTHHAMISTFIQSRTVRGKGEPRYTACVNTIDIVWKRHRKRERRRRAGEGGCIEIEESTHATALDRGASKRCSPSRHLGRTQWHRTSQSYANSSYNLNKERKCSPFTCGTLFSLHSREWIGEPKRETRKWIGWRKWALLINLFFTRTSSRVASDFFKVCLRQEIKPNAIKDINERLWLILLTSTRSTDTNRQTLERRRFALWRERVS